MTGKRLAAISSVITFALISIFAGQSVLADWGVSFYGETSSPRYSYYGDRLTSEYRRGYQVDDWIERGSSSVTESPIFTDGIRLASWATQYDDDFDFGMASAIYFFEVPNDARSVRVKIYYEGEADRSDFNGGITGRVWVKKAYIGDDYTEYYPDEGRYEDEDQPLYGDTFVLRSKKHLEILRISAEDHVIDGMLELHVVAEGKQRLDVKYVEVESFSYMPSVRVVNRYYRDYTWRPWYDYTYWHFYTGPIFHFSDHYYVRYTYPHYRQNYITIRKRYNNYLRGYYVRRPERRVRWSNLSYVSRGTHRTWERDRLNRWTREHDDARRSYVITSAKKRKPDEVRKARTRVRSVLSSHTRVSPATTRARSGITTGAPSVQRRASTPTRSSNTSAVKRRSESSAIQRREQSRTSSALRRQTEATQSTRQPTKRMETPTRTRGSNSNTRSSVRTRSTSPNRNESESSVKKSPTRSVRESQTRQKREVKSRTETRKSGTSTKRAPSTTPSKKDDDDEDEKKKRSTNTRSSSSTSSSTTRKSVRTRSR